VLLLLCMYTVASRYSDPRDPAMSGEVLPWRKNCYVSAVRSCSMFSFVCNCDARNITQPTFYFFLRGIIIRTGTYDMSSAIDTRIRGSGIRYFLLANTSCCFTLITPLGSLSHAWLLTGETELNLTLVSWNWIGAFRDGNTHGLLFILRRNEKS